MIEAFKVFVNEVSSPVSIFTFAVVLFVLFIQFPRHLTKPWVASLILVFVLAFFGVGLTDPHFRSIVTLPDNVPIVGMLFIFVNLLISFD